MVWSEMGWSLCTDDLRGLSQPGLGFWESVTSILHLSGFNWAGSCFSWGGGTEHPEPMAQEWD